MKLHLCCGDVYLEGYTNIDIDGTLSTDITNNQNLTTLNNYYKYNFKQDSPRPFIIDERMSILESWYMKDESVDEVVLISAIEHFTKKQAMFIISEVKRVLKDGGQFIFDFPDIVKDVENYAQSDPEFLMELIYCNHKNQYSIHNWGYTFQTASQLLGEGWKCIDNTTVVRHDYPMTGIVAVRCR